MHRAYALCLRPPAPQRGWVCTPRAGKDAGVPASPLPFFVQPSPPPPPRQARGSSRLCLVLRWALRGGWMGGHVRPLPLSWAGLQFMEQMPADPHRSPDQLQWLCPAFICPGLWCVLPSPLCLHLPGVGWQLVDAVINNRHYHLGPLSKTKHQ